MYLALHYELVQVFTHLIKLLAVGAAFNHGQSELTQLATIHVGQLHNLPKDGGYMLKACCGQLFEQNTVLFNEHIHHQFLHYLEDGSLGEVKGTNGREFVLRIEPFTCVKVLENAKHD